MEEAKRLTLRPLPPTPQAQAKPTNAQSMSNLRANLKPVEKTSPTTSNISTKTSATERSMSTSSMGKNNSAANSRSNSAAPAVAPAVAPASPTSPERMSVAEYRSKIVQEILDTEHSYLTSLNVMIKRYLIPLRENPKLSKEPIADIFGNVEDILATNEVLYKALLDKVAAQGKQDCMFGETFFQEGSLLKPHYMAYTQNYQNAQNALANCEKNVHFAAFLKETQESGAEGLRSLQIKPIQRITRYTLLLGDLVKRTPPEHPDHNTLNESHQKMLKTAKTVNEVVTAGENRQKILNIQNQFLGRMNLLEAHREFLREGILMKVCRKSTKQRWFFLFNDILIHASLAPLGVKFTCHQIWKLSDIRTEDLANKDNSGTAFQIVTASKSFVVYAISKQEKLDWLQTLNTAMDTYAKKRATFGDKNLAIDDRVEAPVWQQDSEAPNCSLCNSEFGWFNRRHHCRACGRVACDNCTSKRMALKNMGSSPVRVCDTCYTDLAQQPPST